MARMTQVTCLFLSGASIASAPLRVGSRHPGGPSDAHSPVSLQDIGTLEPRIAGGATIGSLGGMGDSVALQVFASFVTFKADGTLVSGTLGSLGGNAVIALYRLHDF